MNGSKAQLKEHMDINDFDMDFIGGFIKDINNQEPLYVFIKGHLYLESLMIKMLEEHFSYPVKMHIFNFVQKLEMIQGLGIIDSFDKNALSKINTLRNRLAHSVEMEINEDIVEELISTLPKKIKDKLEKRSKDSEFNKLQCFFMELFAYLLFRLHYPFREWV
ncbi:hypothetical protein ACUTUE_09875 [Bacillus sp. NA_146.1]